MILADTIDCVIMLPLQKQGENIHKTNVNNKIPGYFNERINKQMILWG